ncbi:MAG: response regulator [Gammaproteobacteria bacterium]
MPDTHKKTILLVEDNPDDVELTLRAFRQNQISNRIDVAVNGPDALTFLHSQSSGTYSNPLPEVMLLDLKLPMMDGLEVLQAVRAHPRTRHLPVVILTSSKEEKDLVSGYRLGANSYVRKPVSFHEFTEAVRELGLYWLLWNEIVQEETPPPE